MTLRMEAIIHGTSPNPTQWGNEQSKNPFEQLVTLIKGV